MDTRKKQSKRDEVCTFPSITNFPRTPLTEETAGVLKGKGRISLVLLVNDDCLSHSVSPFSLSGLRSVSPSSRSSHYVPCSDFCFPHSYFPIYPSTHDDTKTSRHPSAICPHALHRNATSSRYT